MAFTYRITVTVTSNSALLPATQTDYPLWIDITDPVLKTVSEGGFVESEFDAFDVVAFADFDLTIPLPFEIERDNGLGYDGTMGRWRGHVKIDIEPGKVFYLGVGCPDITTVQGTPASTWDSNFKGVYHFNTAALVGVAGDSTSNGNTGFASGTTKATDGNSQLYQGLDFDGSTAFVDLDQAGAHYNPLTVSAWVKADAATGQQQIVSKGYDGTNTEWQLYADGNHFGWNSYDGSINGIVSSDQTFSIDEDVFLVGTYDGTQWRLYINGVEDANSPVTATGPISTARKITAGAVDSSLDGYIQKWAGVIDEVRLSNIARSPDWITTDYYSQSDPATFSSFSVAAVSTATPRLRGVTQSNLSWR